MILSVIHDVFRIQCIFNSNKLSIQKVKNNEKPYIEEVINQRFLLKQVNAEDGGVIFKNRGVYYNSFKIFLF